MNTITKYLKKNLGINGSKQPESILQQSTSQQSTQSQSIQQRPINSELSLSSINITSSKEAETPLLTSTSTSTNENDIGLFIGSKITDEKKYYLLTHHFEPNEQFKWPHSERKILKKGEVVIEKRYLNKSHLENHKWLKYSLNKKGLFCVPCVLFSTTTKQICSLGKLINKPLTDYRKLMGEDGYITLHSRQSYHQHNMSKAEHFLFIYNKNPSASIDVLLDDKRRQQILENRERLKPIIRTILLCGKQNIPLRGHRDDGSLCSNSNDDSIVKDGNFRALLNYRIEAGDSILREHLQSCDKNATYISKTVQNQLIQVIGTLIIKQIIEEVKQAKFFTVLLDETADISNVEQASLCLRYVYNGMIHEKFIKFIPVTDRSGAGLANLLLKEVADLGLNLEFCIGQGYDGCNTMSGHINGCQAIVKRQHPQILYVHCVSHSLNLALSDSCDVRLVENSIGTIKEIYNFFRSSSVRTDVLNEHAKELNLKKKELQIEINNQATPGEEIVLKNLKTKLANVCVTRWVERHTSVDTFYSLYPAVMDALQQLTENDDKNVSTKANIFFNSSLQSSKIDLMECLDAIDDVVHVIQKIRDDPDEEYKYIFEEAVDLAKHTGTTIKMPRIVPRQQHRNNIPAANEYEYYKLNLFIPLLDHFLKSLKDRFNMHVKQAATISCIIPKYIHDKTFDDLIPSVDLYHALLPGSFDQIKCEFIQWKNKWANIYKENTTITTSPNTATPSTKRKLVIIPDTAIDSFNECNEAFYPNIKILLQIFSTLPVSTATAERSFSVLKLIKNYLRSTISETRLNGLALMYIYSNSSIDIETVITEFSRLKHRINFSI
ncbi:unnamed protein product [Adineta steineri]|uniref:52 kDa repressor of the inhibitor of the protein kinase-like n=1 Tax=Adineta steineri TaxID=433720 RepID=A0A815F5M1_9BILA|nr:unnamed protein product [Adineta steineri]CAF1333654.1 unnamed protein product [Adineta steineri]CAF3585671.1 unnamed protein product [Adineta steineri]CAF4158587.1 unnamed protein product [Adineta steineri]